MIGMRVFIHDLETKDFLALFPKPLDKTLTISDNGTIYHCLGCFGCWIKTPGECVIRDEYGNMGEHLSRCSQLLIMSQCCYGGFSPFVKNVLDRSISYIHPDFQIRNGRMHHQRRYSNEIDLKVWFYGENITEKEKQTAQRLVQANAINLDCHVYSVSFAHSIVELEEKVLWL